MIYGGLYMTMYSLRPIKLYTILGDFSCHTIKIKINWDVNRSQDVIEIMKSKITMSQIYDIISLKEMGKKVIDQQWNSVLSGYHMVKDKQYILVGNFVSHKAEFWNSESNLPVYYG